MFSQKVLAVLGKADYVVIFILLGLSVLNVAIILERWFFYYSVGQRPARFRQLWEEFLLNPTLPKWQELSALYSFWEIQLLRDLLAKPMGPVREAYFQLWWETFKRSFGKKLGIIGYLSFQCALLGVVGNGFWDHEGVFGPFSSARFGHWASDGFNFGSVVGHRRGFACGHSCGFSL